MEQLTLDLMQYLSGSVSAFHAVANAAALLEQSGAVRLEECARWQLAPGKTYYVTRNLSSLIAFRVPETGFAPLQVVASHSDSPVFRIKEKPEIGVKGHYIQLNTERYGGMILSSWLDRPLSIAGRVLVRTADGLATRLVAIDRDLVVIPNVAIHMNREINDGFKYNPQQDMLPLFGDETAAGRLDAMIAEAAGAAPEEIAGSDLYIYNRMQPSLWGAGEEFFSAARIDDLECAYTSLRAFLAARPSRHMNFLCIFDNEEVGSGTRQGADSTFFEDVVVRAAHALHADADALRAALASSFLVSADNAHAVHPAHPEKTDSENCVYMNGGIVVKFSANQKYTSDGASKAVFSEICRAADVPVQYFVNRSDMTGGSTLGNISCAHISLPSVDVGLAQLAMHSSYETAGVRDIAAMVKGLTAFYEAEINQRSDGEYRLSLH